MSGPAAATGLGRLVEHEGAAGRVSLVSPKLGALGLRHGFTTRAGGLDVRTAADLLGPLSDAGLPCLTIDLGPQPHGRGLSDPESRGAPADARFGPPGAGVVAVRTADCLALLLAGPAGVVAVHAGWRGLLAGVVPAAVARLGGGSRVEAAAIGPAISAAAFVVREDVRSAFAEAGLGAVIRRGEGGAFHVDLLAVALHQLAWVGVDARRVDAACRCTFGEPDRFYSFRRDGPGRGHQAAWICPPERP